MSRTVQLGLIGFVVVVGLLVARYVLLVDVRYVFGEAWGPLLVAGLVVGGVLVGILIERATRRR